MIAKVFTHNGVQTVYLPADARFPIAVKEVIVRIRGKERIITPIENAWDHFFLNGPKVTADFFKKADDVFIQNVKNEHNQNWYCVSGQDLRTYLGYHQWKI